MGKMRLGMGVVEDFGEDESDDVDADGDKHNLRMMVLTWVMNEWQDPSMHATVEDPH